MALVQLVSLDELGLTIKFDKFVKVTSLVNAAFSLRDSHSHVILFNPIDQFDDYNSISRTLRLTFIGQTLPVETYTFSISGLLDAANMAFPDYSLSFVAGDATPAEITELVPDPVDVIDKSIQSEVFLSPEVIFAANPGFYVVETDPPTFDLYVPLDYNNGRVTITFSGIPDPSFLNARYFKVQRKFIQRLPTRWETLTVGIAVDLLNPMVVNIDFSPIDDATPSVYFVEGYKYRIILSKDIGN